MRSRSQHWFIRGLNVVWPILMLSFLTGCAQAFGGPAYQALVPMLVERRDLANAIALNSIQFNLARVVGPAIGGLALATFGTALCFGLNGHSFVAVIIALSALSIQHIPRVSTGKLHREIRSEMSSGLAFVGRQEALRSLTLLAFTSAFCATQLITFLPVFAKDIFHTGPWRGYSSLLSTSGAGAVTGALLVAWLGDLHRKGRTALLMQLMLGLVLIAFALSPIAWLAYPLVFLGGVFMMSVFALISSLVQLLVTDENARARHEHLHGCVPRRHAARRTDHWFARQTFCARARPGHRRSAPEHCCLQLSSFKSKVKEH